jgi:hypothetical protein
MVEQQPSKLNTRVRFPPPAPNLEKFMKITMLAVMAAIALSLSGTSAVFAAPVDGTAISGASNFSVPISRARWCHVHRWCKDGHCWLHRHC